MREDRIPLSQFALRHQLRAPRLEGESATSTSADKDQLADVEGVLGVQGGGVADVKRYEVKETFNLITANSTRRCSTG